ncbi:YceI family protein [Hoyosella sp. G463]|uniref:YceI family protein n=1 Tax=Lolliginicoccus lacisalsi TaxID=2742202 RepID=A0A927PN67_9ACTN|nr:YceI family protein [Lolliginicoccus lacisalsi]MBD8507667.1 YceI family protein [Lolliginicoccus lacisalsi]
MLAAGEYLLGPENPGHGSDQLAVRTSRAGVGARVGHDLVINAAQWSARVTVPPSGPGDATIAATIQTGSLAITQATGGVKPMSASDRRTTEKNMRGVLKPHSFPTATFTSTSVAVDGNSLQVEGDLALLGVSRPVALTGTIEASGQVEVSAGIRQSRWGITPFSAFLGALRLADEVTIAIQGPLEPDGAR